MSLQSVKISRLLEILSKPQGGVACVEDFEVWIAIPLFALHEADYRVI